jgi:two-component system, NtrC family, response regulator GlrR
MDQGKILVVDDDPNILELVAARLRSERYAVATAMTAEDALAMAKEESFNVVITDFKLSTSNGLALMEDLLFLYPDLPVIIVTAFGTVEGAVTAIEKGAYSYLTKPFEPKDLLLKVKNALEKQRLAFQVRNLKTLVEEKYGFANIVGRSEKMIKVFEQINQVARTDFTVRIYGESGTGKELVAKAIHCHSLRESAPFIAVSCGALPETLLESELFGHEKGAFTDARQSRKGLFALADKGTIFLDEIGETPPSLQVKLLRVIQEQEFKPVGSERTQKVDVRIIVATNKDLKKEVEAGRFREDLYYRVQVIPLDLPPLRERKEDIALLAEHFLKIYSRKLDKKMEGIAPEALQRMMLYDWPGNVRELENKIEYAVAMSGRSRIGPDDILISGPPADREIKTFDAATEEFERDYLEKLLRMTKGNVQKAAQLADKQRTHLYYLMNKFGLKPSDFR